MKRIAGFVCLCVTALAAVAGQLPDYQFQRQWPAIPQPWYFHNQTAAEFDSNGFMYVSDWLNNRISKFTIEGQFVKSIRISGICPINLHVDHNDNVYVLSNCPYGVTRLNTDLETVNTIGTLGIGPGQYTEPTALAVSRANVVFVLDRGTDQVLKFDPDGNFQSSWAYTAIYDFVNPANQDGNRRVHDGIAIDDAGLVYLPDHFNDQIVQLDADGNEQLRWGGTGSGDGQLSTPLGMRIAEGFLYVADAGNNRVQKFDLNGNFVRAFGQPGRGPGQFILPDNVSVDPNGFVWVNNLFPWTISKFTNDGDYVTQIRSTGSAPGFFDEPTGLDIDSNGRIVISGAFNNRIQIFDASGNFLTQSTMGAYFHDVAVDPDDNLVVAGNGTIWRYDSNAGFLNSFSGSVNPSPQFYDGFGVAVDSAGAIYYTDTDSSQIRKFDAAGNLLFQFGSNGQGDGQFITPGDVAVDATGNVYVSEYRDFRFPLAQSRIQKFDGQGNFLLHFDPVSATQKIFLNDDRLYVTGLSSSSIGVFNLDGSQIGSLLSFGSAPGQLVDPTGVAIGPNDELAVVDRRNNRALRFGPTTIPDGAKAIIVAAGGPFPGNALWSATQANANFAYRTLVYQGFSKETIRYLSDDADLDLDENGILDEVSGGATVANLQDAILGSFAADASELVLYIVDHGGLDTIRVSGKETLRSGILGGFLDTWQQNHPDARVTLVYDACQSGSFVDDLANSGFDRTVIASAMSDENAYFVSQGSLSFSTHFWTHIFNGESVGDAFSLATQSVATAFPQQNPVLDTNNNSIGNEPLDQALARQQFIGNGTAFLGSRPVIGSVTPAQNLATGSTATIEAFSVIDGDEISRVWAVMRPPGFNPGSADNPIADLPTVELLGSTDDNFSAVYDGFTQPGIYQIAVYARDFLGNTAVPELTTVTVQNPLRRRAVVIGSGADGDADARQFRNMASFAVAALEEQGYGADGFLCADSTCDNIQYLVNEGLAGSDATVTESNIRFAIEDWGTDGVQDLTVFLAGRAQGGAIRLDQTQTLSSATLAPWLDTAQAAIPGKLTVIVEADGATDYTAALNPGMSTDRILIASSSAGEPATIINGGAISFSRFFWTQTLNGARVLPAFQVARSAVSFNTSAALPALNDNGNNISNELLDGFVAARYSIGSGYLLAGDSPLVDAVSSLTDPATGLDALVVSDVTSTGQVAQVLAVVTRPDGSVFTQPLQRQGATGFSDPSYGLCGPAGDYQVAAYAVDVDGHISLPATFVVSRSNACVELLFLAGFE